MCSVGVNVFVVFFVTMGIPVAAVVDVAAVAVENDVVPSVRQDPAVVVSAADDDGDVVAAAVVVVAVVHPSQLNYSYSGLAPPLHKKIHTTQRSIFDQPSEKLAEGKRIKDYDSNFHSILLFC